MCFSLQYNEYIHRVLSIKDIIRENQGDTIRKIKEREIIANTYHRFYPLFGSIENKRMENEKKKIRELYAVFFIWFLAENRGRMKIPVQPTLKVFSLTYVHKMTDCLFFGRERGGGWVIQLTNIPSKNKQGLKINIVALV